MTLPDGVEMYAQFLLPARRYDSPETNNMFVESFLSVAMEKGLEEAIRVFKDATSKWTNEHIIASKGLLVSNEGALTKWIPFGPAIKGTYDDYGNCKPIDSPENNIRLAILKEMTGLEYYTLEDAATDDRWISYGLDGDKGQKESWGLRGLPENYKYLDLLKGLSITHFNAGAYETLVANDFSATNGTIVNGDFDDDWISKRSKEILSKIEEYKKLLEKKPSEYRLENLETRWKFDALLETMGPIFKNVDPLYREKFIEAFFTCKKHDWYIEQQKMSSSMSYLNIPLRQSEYGSQEKKWKGLSRIWKGAIECNNKLGPDYNYDALTEAETLEFDATLFKKLAQEIMTLGSNLYQIKWNGGKPKPSEKKQLDDILSKYRIF